jgi:rhodanese-related sulfurtransferase
MKRHIITIAAILMMAIPFAAHAEELSLEIYISEFDYKARKEMKINSESLVSGLEQGLIQLVDIRFKEETAAWSMGFGRHIPLNELPSRLDELDKDKIIVTACPHKDRAILAMAYLRTKGYNSKYLVDGLLGLAEFLRGDTARNVMEILEENRGG